MPINAPSSSRDLVYLDISGDEQPQSKASSTKKAPSLAHSNSTESFDEIRPLLEQRDTGYIDVSSDTPAERVLSGGGHVDESQGAVSSELRSAIKGRLVFLKSMMGTNIVGLPEDKVLSSESDFATLEKFIKGIGSEDMSYLKTIWYRSPKQGKETYNLVKKAASSLAGVSTAYVIGNALGLPTGFIFGSQLGDIFSGYYSNTVGVFEKGERPLGQEFMQKWVYLKVALKENFNKLDDNTRDSAMQLQNFIDFCAADYVKPSRDEELTSTNLDYAAKFVLRYAFILSSQNIKSKAAFVSLDSTLDESVPYLKRLKYFDESRREEIQEIQRNIINNVDPDQQPGLPVTKFLGGPGGTGKTSLIKMMADYLKLNFKSISLTKVTLEKLRGEQEFSLMGQHPIDDMVGLLAMTLVRMGSGILFIDEADCLNETEFEGYFKSIFQDKNPVINISSLNISLDLSRFVFFFAGNIYLKDPALLQRLGNLPFDGLSKQEKMNAANEQLAEIYPKIEQRQGLVVLEKIKTISSEWIDYIADLDLARNSGGRVIKLAIESFCGRLEERLKSNIHADFSNQVIEKMILDIYKRYPAEESLDQRVEPVERENSIQFLNNFENKIQNNAKYKVTLEVLQKEVKQAKVGLNDQAMLLILSALTGEDEKLQITDPKEQASALYLVGALATVSGRQASEPQKTMLSLHACLEDLLTSLNNTINNSDCILRTLTIMRNILNVIPKKNDVRSTRVHTKTVEGLKEWSKKNTSLDDSVKAQLKLLI